MIRQIILRAVALTAFLLLVLLWVIDPTLSQDPVSDFLWRSVCLRFAGSIVFLMLLCSLKYRVMEKFSAKHLAVLLPCLLVVVNNLPLLSLLDGSCRVMRPDLIWLFALDCLLVGIFEELAFRGTLFLAILERRRQSTGQIVFVTVLASALFGLVHLANLAEGADVGATLLQVGYSFLIGGMCSIVLLKTGNLIFCILLHAIYDFCGGLLPTLGEGRWWDLPTVIVTAILAFAVSTWMVYTLCRVRPTDLLYFFPSTKEVDGKAE